MAFVFVLSWTGMAAADSPGTAAVAFVPADGRAQGVELRTQTVDAILSEVDGRLFAETAVWVRLFNPASASVTVTIGIPGLQTSPRPLPENLVISLDGRSFEMPLVAPTNPDLGPQRAAPVILSPGKTISLRATYSQSLPVFDGLAFFAYPLTAADQWANTPESLRVTVEFSPGFAAGQVQAEAPPAHRRETRRLTWDWERTRALEDVNVAFLTNEWWKTFETAQAAASAPEATATDYLALGRQYVHLARLPAMDISSPDRFWDRYAPGAVAAFQSAAAIADEASATDNSVEAQLALAELYLAQATRLTGEIRESSLQLAVGAAEAALELQAKNTNALALVGSAYDMLAQIAGAQGDPARQAEYLRRRAARTLPREKTQQRLAQLRAAAAAAQRGELGEAREIVSALLGSEALTIPAASAPLARQALVAVATSPGERTVALTLVGPDAEQNATKLPSLQDLLAATDAALTTVSGITVTRDRETLTLTLPFASTTELTALQAQIVAALPTAPELALLAAALAPRHIFREGRDGPLRQTTRFTELADLGPATMIWLEQADRLTQAAFALPADTEDEEKAALITVQRAAWLADAAAWETLTRASWASYSIAPGHDDSELRWQLPAGQARTLTAEVATWLPGRARWLAIIGGIFALMVALALWR